MNVLAEYLIPLTSVGGYTLFMKSSTVDPELDDAKGAIVKLGGMIDSVNKFDIDEDYSRSIIKIKKISSSPAKYPRNPGNDQVKTFGRVALK